VTGQQKAPQEQGGFKPYTVKISIDRDALISGIRAALIAAVKVESAARPEDLEDRYAVSQVGILERVSRESPVLDPGSAGEPL
jgi:hypothetical protein